jgi:hypothetical protein
LANALAAITAARRASTPASAAWALPVAPGASGNLPIEDLTHALLAEGIDTASTSSASSMHRGWRATPSGVRLPVMSASPDRDSRAVSSDDSTYARLRAAIVEGRYAPVRG